MTAAEGHTGLESWQSHQSASTAACSRWSHRAGDIAHTSPQALMTPADSHIGLESRLAPVSHTDNRCQGSHWAGVWQSHQSASTADWSRWSHRAGVIACTSPQALLTAAGGHIGPVVKARTSPQTLMTAADCHIGLELWELHQSASITDCSRWLYRAIARTHPQSLLTAGGGHNTLESRLASVRKH